MKLSLIMILLHAVRPAAGMLLWVMITLVALLISLIVIFYLAHIVHYLIANWSEMSSCISTVT